MRILYIHSLMFHHRTWSRLAHRLAGNGIELLLSDQMGAAEVLADSQGEIDMLLSFMAGRLLRQTDQIDLLQKLDVPIIQLLRAHGQTPDQWREDPPGGAAGHALLLRHLADAGYDVGDAPASGTKILETIMERKAVAEFRWSTVDEIVTKGGDL